MEIKVQVIMPQLGKDFVKAGHRDQAQFFSYMALELQKWNDTNIETQFYEAGKEIFDEHKPVLKRALSMLWADFEGNE